MAYLTFFTPTSDVYGYSAMDIHNINSSASFINGERRDSYTRTLDGGLLHVANGFYDAGQEFNIGTANLTQDQREIVLYLHKNYTSVGLCCPEGVFLGVIHALSGQGKVLTITYKVLSKESI
jgi:hypothetical protein